MSDFDEEIPDLIFFEESNQGKPLSECNELNSQGTESQPNSSEILPDLQSPRTITTTPLTILTGWLGSGKTSLLHNIVDHVSRKSQTVAILQNETSSFMGVEKALKLTDENNVFGEILEIADGCVCCSVRSDFLLAIDTLLNQRHFDYVVLECSGIADVGNLITNLWADKSLGSLVTLDGVVCLVDCFQLLNSTNWGSNRPPQCQEYPNKIVKSQTSTSSMLNILKNQIVYSDTVIINKLDQCLFESTIHHNSFNEATTPALDHFSHPRYLSPTQPPDQSQSSELSSMISYLNSLTQPQNPTSPSQQSPTDTATTINLNHSLLQTSKPLSKQLSAIISHLVAMNPTVSFIFSSFSNIPIPSILDQQRYALNSTTTFNTQGYITSTPSTPHSTEPSSTLGSHHATQDKPKSRYVINGVEVFTENPHLIPNQYRDCHHKHRHDHVDSSPSCDSTSLCSPPSDCSSAHHCTDGDHHHHHHHEHTEDCASHHHDSHASNSHSQDPHGIATIVLTYKQPQTETSGTSMWGMDIHTLTRQFDDLLFSDLQNNVEADWTAERAQFRERFHQQGENPQEIVDELLQAQKQRKIEQRRQDMGLDAENQAESGDSTLVTLPQNNETTSPLPLAEDDEEILVVPQMDGIVSNKEVIYRMKGVFSIRNRIPKWYLQAVFNTFDLSPAEAYQTEEHSSLHDELYCNPLLYEMGLEDLLKAQRDPAQSTQDTPNPSTTGRDVDSTQRCDVWKPNEERYCSMIVIGVNIDVQRLVDIFLSSVNATAP